MALSNPHCRAKKAPAIAPAPEPVAALTALGGRAADTLAGVLDGADVLILMLPDSQIVASVMADPGLHAALRAGLLVIDMGSSEPVKTRALAAELDAIDVELVDAPVSGGVSGAVNGTLTIMVGGAARAVARVTPMLANLGTVRHAGAVGSGHARVELKERRTAGVTASGPAGVDDLLPCGVTVVETRQRCHGVGLVVDAEIDVEGEAFDGADEKGGRLPSRPLPSGAVSGPQRGHEAVGQGPAGVAKRLGHGLDHAGASQPVALDAVAVSGARR